MSYKSKEGEERLNEFVTHVSKMMNMCFCKDFDELMKTGLVIQTAVGENPTYIVLGRFNREPIATLTLYRDQDEEKVQKWFLKILEESKIEERIVEELENPKLMDEFKSLSPKERSAKFKELEKSKISELQNEMFLGIIEKISEGENLPISFSFSLNYKGDVTLFESDRLKEQIKGLWERVKIEEKEEKRNIIKFVSEPSEPNKETEP